MEYNNQSNYSHLYNFLNNKVLSSHLSNRKWNKLEKHFNRLKNNTYKPGHWAYQDDIEAHKPVETYCTEVFDAFRKLNDASPEFRALCSGAACRDRSIRIGSTIFNILFRIVNNQKCNYLIQSFDVDYKSLGTFVVYQSSSDLGMLKYRIFDSSTGRLFSKLNDYVTSTFINMDLQSYIQQCHSTIPNFTRVGGPSGSPAIKRYNILLDAHQPQEAVAYYQNNKEEMTNERNQKENRTHVWGSDPTCPDNYHYCNSNPYGYCVPGLNCNDPNSQGPEISLVTTFLTALSKNPYVIDYFGNRSRCPLADQFMENLMNIPETNKCGQTEFDSLEQYEKIFKDLAQQYKQAFEATGGARELFTTQVAFSRHHTLNCVRPDSVKGFSQQSKIFNIWAYELAIEENSTGNRFKYFYMEYSTNFPGYGALYTYPLLIIPEDSYTLPWGVYDCYVPGGLYFCKPVEYLKQGPIKSKDECSKRSLTPTYLFIGDLLSGETIPPLNNQVNQKVRYGCDSVQAAPSPATSDTPMKETPTKNPRKRKKRGELLSKKGYPCLDKCTWKNRDYGYYNVCSCETPPYTSGFVKWDWDECDANECESRDMAVTMEY